MRTVKYLSLFALTAVPMFAGFDGTATLTYVPVAGTPTLSETMLIALGLLLPIVAFRSLRNMKGGSSLAALLVFGGLLASEAFTGYSLLPRTQAIPPGFMGNLAGGTLSNLNVSALSPITVTNATNVRMLIQSLSWTLGSGVTVRTGGTNCAQGMILNASGTCTLAVNAPDGE